jgi:hypothetical protein
MKEEEFEGDLEILHFYGEIFEFEISLPVPAGPTYRDRLRIR